MAEIQMDVISVSRAQVPVVADDFPASSSTIIECNDNAAGGAPAATRIIGIYVTGPIVCAYSWM